VLAVVATGFDKVHGYSWMAADVNRVAAL
jgi:hypothetical protein